jgi:hypothetical protein
MPAGKAPQKIIIDNIIREKSSLRASLIAAYRVAGLGLTT